MIQATHLTSKVKAPQLKSYVAYRKNRDRSRPQGTTKGEGVMTLVKEELQHRMLKRNLTQANDDTTYALGISVEGAEQDLKRINLYTPPIRGCSADGRTQSYSTRFLPDDNNTVIAADAIAHSL